MKRGGYTFDACIAKGAYGKVWRGKREGETYAIKEIPGEKGGVLFPNEIDILRRLKHPHLLSGRDFFFAPGTKSRPENSLYLVTDLGTQTLYSYVLEKQPLLTRRITLAKEVLGALQYLHQNGLYHNDLKPDNIIMFGETSRLGDFGIASHSLELLIPRRIWNCHTLTCAAPEAIRNLHGLHIYELGTPIVETVSLAGCTVWAFGVLLIFLLSGKILFPGKETEIIYMLPKFLKNREAYLEEYGLSRPWRELILSLLEPDPSKRLKLEELCSHPLFDLAPTPTPFVLYPITKEVTISLYSLIDTAMESIISNDGSIRLAFLAGELLYRSCRSLSSDSPFLAEACVLIGAKMLCETVWIPGPEVVEQEELILQELEGHLSTPTLWDCSPDPMALERNLRILLDPTLYISHSRELLKKYFVSPQSYHINNTTLYKIYSQLM